MALLMRRTSGRRNMACSRARSCSRPNKGVNWAGRLWNGGACLWVGALGKGKFRGWATRMEGGFMAPGSATDGGNFLALIAW